MCFTDEVHNPGNISQYVLVSAEIELIFFPVVGIVLFWILDENNDKVLIF